MCRVVLHIGCILIHYIKLFKRTTLKTALPDELNKFFSEWNVFHLCMYQNEISTHIKPKKDRS